MNQERLLIDFIEDYENEQILQSARHRLLVIEKNILNLKKNIEIYIRESADSNERIKICQSRLNFINADIRSVENLKYNIEAKIAEFIESIESPDSLPIVFDPELELFIDQKIEYYSNHVVRHRALSEKKNQISVYLRRLNNLLEDQKKDLLNNNELVAKYNNYIPELRSKQIQTSAEINAIEGDILAFLEGSSTVSQEMNNLIKGRFEMLQDILEGKMRTLMQLNGFSHHIRSECVKHVNAVSDLNEKNELVQEEINRTMALLNDTNTEQQTVEMKYGKVEQQIHKYIQIQEEMNTIDKCRAYYDLISTYEQERVNAQRILDSFVAKNMTDVVQLSSSEANLASLLEEKRQMEITITSLINAPM